MRRPRFRLRTLLVAVAALALLLAGARAGLHLRHQRRLDAIARMERRLLERAERSERRAAEFRRWAAGDGETPRSRATCIRLAELREEMAAEDRALAADSARSRRQHARDRW